MSVNVTNSSGGICETTEPVSWQYEYGVQVYHAAFSSLCREGGAKDAWPQIFLVNAPSPLPQVLKNENKKKKRRGKR